MRTELCSSAETVSEGTRYDENNSLIMRAQSEDAEDAARATEELMRLNDGLVRHIAMRFRDRGIELEDLFQIGRIGLLRAVRSFDLSRELRFSTYAVPMIMGEIRRTLRDEGLIKVSRYYKKIGAALMRASNEITEREGEEPRLSRLAEIVGITPEEAAVALDAMSPVQSLSDFVYGEDSDAVLEDTIADCDSLDANEKFFTSMALQEAIGAMCEQWQRIVMLRYFRSYTQEQTAAALGLSQVKVSREEKKIVAFLREKMQ